MDHHQNNNYGNFTIAQQLVYYSTAVQNSHKSLLMFMVCEKKGCVAEKFIKSLPVTEFSGEAIMYWQNVFLTIYYSRAVVPLHDCLPWKLFTFEGLVRKDAVWLNMVALWDLEA